MFPKNLYSSTIFLFQIKHCGIVCLASIKERNMKLREVTGKLNHQRHDCDLRSDGATGLSLFSISIYGTLIW